MRIARVEPVTLGYRIGHPAMARGFALVRIETDTGLVGWGEASTNWGHSFPGVFAAVVDRVCNPVLLGAEPRDIRARVADLRARMDGYLGWDGVTSQTIGAIEVALWDILGRSLDAPVHRLLGGSGEAVALYGTGTTMFEATPEWHAAYFDDAVRAGIRTVKVRLGRSIEDDVAVVAAVRARFGDAVAIGVDSYWFHDARQALRLAERLAPLGVVFFEEPVPQYRSRELAWLSERSPIPLAVGERVFGARQFAALAEDRAAAIFQPDATICGGILECLEVAGIADRAGIALHPHTGGPTAVGLAATLHWASAVAAPLVEVDLVPDQPLVAELAPQLVLPWAGDGRMAPPDGPGLGIEVPDDLAERFPYVAGDTYPDLFPEHERGRAAVLR